jgi:hypothetical protein
LKQVFPHVLGADVSNNANTILIATRHDPQTMAGIASLGLPMKAERALEQLAMPRYWQTPPDALVLTDEVAPVEWLTDRIFLRHIFRTFQRDDS